MSPLLKGTGTVKKNVEELVKGKVGKSRRKAIKTLAKKHGISEKEVRLKQALAISYAQAKKR